METEVIPPFVDEAIFLFVADALFKVVAGNSGPVLYLLYQCVQNTLFIFVMDQLYVFVQSAGPALGPRFDALGCGEWGSRML